MGDMNKATADVLGWLIGLSLFGGAYTALAFLMAYALEVDVAVSGIMIVTTLGFGSLLSSALEVLSELMKR